MRKYHPWILWFLWIIVIFSFSLQPGSTSSETSGRIVTLVYQMLTSTGIDLSYDTLTWIVRKGAHMANFFIFAWISIYTQKQKTYKQTLIFALLAGIIVASLDESLQTLIDGRAGSILDVGIDTLGTLLALSIYSIYTRRKYL